MSSTRKHLLDPYDTIGINRSKRLTRSTVGSAVNIPIVLDSDSSDSDNSNFDSDNNSNSLKSVSPIINSKKIKKKDELEQVLTNSRILNSEKRKSLGITTRKKITQKQIKIKKKPLLIKKLIPSSNIPSQNNSNNNKNSVVVDQSNSKKISTENSSLFSAKNTTIVSSSSLSSTPSSTSSSSIPSSSIPSSSITPSSIITKKSINENQITLTSSTSNLNSNSNSNSIPASNQKSIKSTDTINDKENSNPSENVGLFNKNTNPVVANLVNEKNKKLDNINKSNEKEKEREKEKEKEKKIVFDPESQKSYKDTYSVCCISCKKKNRSEYCNRQLPCDICVGKKAKNCTYPPGAKIAIPARFVKKTKTKSNKYNLNYSSISNKKVDNLIENNLNKKIIKSNFQIDSIANRVNSVNSENSENSENSTNSDRIKPTLKLRNRIENRKSSNNKIKKVSNNKNNDDDIDDFVSDSDNYGASDEDNYSDANNDEDDDDNDDDYNESNERNHKYERPKRINNRENFQIGQDNFVKTQRILKELEFEKRDINDIYVPVTRRKRVATKENYYIPSDAEEEEDDLENNGYAEAEARNENLILSEDEQDRRMLRGDIGIDYVKSARNEMEKRNYDTSDDSLSSDDD